MNLFDALIVLLVVVAAVGGYRLGFVTRVMSWIGMVVGLFLAVRLLPSVLERVDTPNPNLPLVIALGLIFGCALAGQALGVLVGGKLRPHSRAVGRVDRAFGAAAGVAGVVVLLWLMLPLLGDTPGPVAAQARQSRIARGVDDRLPDAPDSIQGLRSLIGEDNFPKVFDALRPTEDLGPPPEATGLADETLRRVARSVVKVEGIACLDVQNGTGFVVAPDLVATNAHVVAGERETDIIRDDGSRVDGEVVAFDPNRDLALIRTSGINRPPLPVVASSTGISGGVFGHPGGGPLRVAPFSVAREVTAVGRDIYHESITRRDVLELRSQLRPGDSGSALVDVAGNVVGVAFAIAPDDPQVAYALSTGELTTLLQGDLSRDVSTGPCIAG